MIQRDSLKVYAAILAGGSGSRMKTALPKQFLKLGGQTILQRTLNRFRDSGRISHVVLAIPAENFEHYSSLIQGYGLGSFLSIIQGGVTRQESSCRTVRWIQEKGGCDLLLIHDAARPFVTDELLEKSILSGLQNGACEVALPSTDTLVEIEDGKIKSVLDRSKIWRVQTPQTFRFHLILEAHEKTLALGITDSSDDAQMVMKLGHSVAVVEGSPDNIKITHPVDLDVAKKLLRKYPG